MRRGSMTITTLLLAGLALLPAGGCSSSGDSGPTEPTGPTTAAGYTDRGWERYEAGNYDGALSDFNAAIDRDAGYGEAYAGRGWTQLARATSPSAMQTAGASFVSAATRGETGAHVEAGRAAASLGAGGTALEAAVTQARAELQADPSFVFEHRTSINAVDVRLIEAFAQAAQGNFDAALTAADFVVDSGIDQGNPATWQVDDDVYTSYLGAVLAHLHKLSGQFSG